eukprot:SM000065S20210  [mRNA]  locus=s65:365914:368898:- [translate_table: standard]
MDAYNQCREPPALHLLDRYGGGGKGACGRVYSDPGAARREWEREQAGTVSARDRLDRLARRERRRTRQDRQERRAAVLQVVALTGPAAARAGGGAHEAHGVSAPSEVDTASMAPSETPSLAATTPGPSSVAASAAAAGLGTSPLSRPFLVGSVPSFDVLDRGFVLPPAPALADRHGDAASGGAVLDGTDQSQPTPVSVPVAQVHELVVEDDDQKAARESEDEEEVHKEEDVVTAEAPVHLAEQAVAVQLEEEEVLAMQGTTAEAGSSDQVPAAVAAEPAEPDGSLREAFAAGRGLSIQVPSGGAAGGHDNDDDSEPGCSDGDGGRGGQPSPFSATSSTPARSSSMASTPQRAAAAGFPLKTSPQIFPARPTGAGPAVNRLSPGDTSGGPIRGWNGIAESDLESMLDRMELRERAGAGGGAGQGGRGGKVLLGGGAFRGFNGITGGFEQLRRPAVVPLAAAGAEEGGATVKGEVGAGASVQAQVVGQQGEEGGEEHEGREEDMERGGGGRSEEGEMGDVVGSTSAEPAGLPAVGDGAAEPLSTVLPRRSPSSGGALELHAGLQKEGGEPLRRSLSAAFSSLEGGEGAPMQAANGTVLPVAETAQRSRSEGAVLAQLSAELSPGTRSSGTGLDLDLDDCDDDGLGGALGNASPQVAAFETMSWASVITSPQRPSLSGGGGSGPVLAELLESPERPATGTAGKRGGIGGARLELLYPGSPVHPSLTVPVGQKLQPPQAAETREVLPPPLKQQLLHRRQAPPRRGAQRP